MTLGEGGRRTARQSTFVSSATRNHDFGQVTLPSFCRGCQYPGAYAAPLAYIQLNDPHALSLGVRTFRPGRIVGMRCYALLDDVWPTPKYTFASFAF